MPVSVVQEANPPDSQSDTSEDASRLLTYLAEVTLAHYMDVWANSHSLGEE